MTYCGIKEVAKILNISEDKAYENIKAGEYGYYEHLY